MNIEIQEYKKFISSIKLKIQSSQIKASIKVNEELLKLYWEIASLIVEKQKTSSWGDKILESISKDLKKEFPNMKGFSKRNLELMRRWYLFYSNTKQLVSQNNQQLVSKIFMIPWGHNILIVSKANSLEEALFYINLTMTNNYSRAMLKSEIEKNIYERQAKAITNFQDKLPEINSQLAIETLKNPYNFDFLELRYHHDEKELEDALVDNITSFLVELGQGFAYLGRQYKLIIDGNEFKIDLLFYHVKLHCYVVVELKTVDFKPEFAGKLNFYISAVDGELKSKEDKPTIGILICKSKNDTIVEYSLKDINKPMGISEYELTKVLPESFKSSLPSIEEIEAEIGDMK